MWCRCYKETSGFGFPSGHVMQYVVFLGMLVFLLTHKMKPSLGRWCIHGTFVLTLVAIGLSRMYLGAHTLGDVVGGYAFGTAVVIIFVGLWLFLVKPRDDNVGAPA